MLRFFGPDGAPPVWYDLQDPSEAERAEVARATGLAVPDRAQIREIESSSRLSRQGDTLLLNMAAVTRAADDSPVATALGFVLGRAVLISVREAPMPAFDAVAERFGGQPARPAGSLDAFVTLLEELVDRSADVLEQIAAKLDAISAEVFHSDDAGGVSTRPDQALFAQLRALGRYGDHVHKVRDALLGARRIVGYVTENAADHGSAEMGGRLATLARDIESLREYDDEHLANKIQFLLDATLGFINILQNNTFKILTIVSLIGIPPTLLAGIWGMNFKAMPELGWTYGYPLAWAAMIVSAILPVVWFRFRRWI